MFNNTTILEYTDNILSSSGEDLKKWFEDLFNKGTLANTTSLELFNKQIEQFNSQAKNSWDQLLKLLQTGYLDTTEKTIETVGQGGPTYKTTIKIDGDIKNDFPTPPPNSNDVYWTRHTQLVDQALSLQKEIITKVIDTIGVTVQKIVNPISISTGDLLNLMNLFRKS
jgi:hypothetical protein